MDILNFLSPEALVKVIEEASDGIIILASDGTILSCNHRAAELFGYTKQEFDGQNLFGFFCDELGASNGAEIKTKIQQNQKVYNEHAYFRQANGAAEPIALSADYFTTESGSHCFVVVRSIRPIKELIRELERKNRELAELTIIDPLTGAYNRRLLDTQLQYEVALVEKRGQPLSVLLVDIDEMKRINDELGHIAGDDILIQFVSLLQNNVERTDFVCRYGGDEFIIILPLTNFEVAQKVASRLIGTVSMYEFRAREQIVKLSVSIGAASRDPEELKNRLDARDLLLKVDRAAYTAKRRGKGQIYPPLPPSKKNTGE